MVRAERMALNILAEYPPTLPINIEQIVADHGIIIDYHPFGCDQICGYYALFDGQPVITVNALHHKRRQRFTLAHELYHHLSDGIMGRLMLAFSDVNHTEKERAADHFAAALLMPKYAFALCYQHRNTMRECADHFGVSAAAACLRAKELGLSMMVRRAE